MSGFGYDENFAKELFFSPEDKDLMRTDVGPSGPGPAASVAAAGGRALRSFVADPVRGMFRSVHKARTTGFSNPEEMVKAGMEFAGNLVGTPGGSGGLGSGWRSRTLEALERNPKLPQAATPQTWLSKLKGMGLPKDEVGVAEGFLGAADPKGKLTREQLHSSLSNNKLDEWNSLSKDSPELMKPYSYWNTKQLPELGVKKTTLGGAEWEAGQKRLDELGPQINNVRKAIDDKIITKAKEMHPVDNEVSTSYWQAHAPIRNAAIKVLKNTDPEFSALQDSYKSILDEHSQLSQNIVGKRPKWPGYNIEGLKDYKEEYYHAPLKDGGTYRNADMEMHFSDKPDNLLYLKHSGTLEFPDGKKSTHMSTLQNDHVAEFDASKSPIIKDASGDKHKKSDLMIKSYYDLLEERKAFGIFKKSGEEAPDLPLFNTEAEAHSYLYPEVPEPIMLNTWWKHGLKSSIEDAVKAGHDYFTWDPAETQMKRFAGAGEDTAQYMKNHYDNNIPGFLKKEYGAVAEKVHTGKGEPSIPYDHDNVMGDAVSDRAPLSEIQITGNDRVGWIMERNGDFIDGPYNTRRDIEDIINTYKKEGKGDEVWRIPITDSIKKQVFGGQFWSKNQPAKPGGKDAEGIA